MEVVDRAETFEECGHQPADGEEERGDCGDEQSQQVVEAGVVGLLASGVEGLGMTVVVAVIDRCDCRCDVVTGS